MMAQNVKSALGFLDDVIALESGWLVFHKPAAEILEDTQMKRFSMGGAETTAL
jgi:branched-chain amino acid transport system ATP-binding protein